MDATVNQLKTLFPAPGQAVSSTITRNAARYPGRTHESIKALLDCMRDNHRRFHIFFGGKIFHNHSTHHLLTIWTMGADAAVIKAAYESHLVYLTPAFKAPITAGAVEQPTKIVINESNWKDYLGNDAYVPFACLTDSQHLTLVDGYYQAYMVFFSDLLLQKKKTMQSVLEDYIFSADANVVPGKYGAKPLMLARFLGGFLHPLIHVGYGMEFSMPGMLVEGVAQTAVETKWAESLYSDSLWTSRTSSFPRSYVTSQDVHAIEVLAQVINDPELEPSSIGILPAGTDSSPQYLAALDAVTNAVTHKLTAYADLWTRTVLPERETIRRKLEELAWMVTLMYGVGGWAGRGQGEDNSGAFNADFFNMHLVTSSLMMISQINALSLSSASLLLRTYFTSALTLYVSRGRPPLPILEFYSATSSTPAPPSPALSPAKDTLLPAETPNPWLPIMQTTLVHADMHSCKTHRALMHYAEEYGDTAPGAFAHLKGVKGVEILDGTLFIRVAGLTANRLGWMREGQERGKYDYSGFYPLKHKL